MIKRLNVRGVSHQELRSQRTGECFSLSAVLTDELGFKDLFVHHDVIPPGRRASGTHFHSHREEMVFVIEGRVRAWCNGMDVVLEPGEIVGFPPGKDNAHYLGNDGDSPARILVIASNPDDDHVGYV